MISKERSPSIEKKDMVWDEIQPLLWKIVFFLDNYPHKFKWVYGVPRGGLIPAVFISHKSDMKFVPDLITLENIHPDEVLIVEDVVDTGETIKDFGSHAIVALVKKPWAPQILYSAYETDKWVKFPWENK